ncbi:S24 family peptidase [Desulfovibrio sp. UCD-KL4C]|uniref:S24 family peptidase n=1 Tax=Desulfovibrio sp. UCD-KL4C TaxID=2578120 RepID=UPI0025BC9AB2|nr:S24 family peptidase [Desulfovibrio sp. UCD-KL4C]
MGYEEIVREQIEKAVEAAGNPTTLAKACGIEQSSLARYLKREQRGLGFSSLVKIMDYLNSALPISALAPHGQNGNGSVVNPECPLPESAGSIFPVYQFAAGGLPISLAEIEPICEVCIPQKFVFSGLMVVQVMGDSMSPLIRNGAYIGINKQEKKIVPGRVYAVDVPYEGLTIKRVFLDPVHGELILRPENPTHPEIRVPIEGRDGLIVGEVMWEMQNLN